jgi:hypothetical protein
MRASAVIIPALVVAEKNIRCVAGGYKDAEKS